MLFRSAYLVSPQDKYIPSRYFQEFVVARFNHNLLSQQVSLSLQHSPYVLNLLGSGLNVLQSYFSISSSKTKEKSGECPIFDSQRTVKSLLLGETPVLLEKKRHRNLWTSFNEVYQ